MANAMNEFRRIRFKAEILERLSDVLNEEIKSRTEEYTIVGKSDEQKTDWRTGELVWADDDKTIPVFQDKWDYVKKSAESITQDDIMAVDVCNELKRELLKLVK